MREVGRESPEPRMNKMTPSEREVDPRRYFEAVDPQRTDIAQRDPVCLYLETTNRCNLPCTTCPHGALP